MKKSQKAFYIFFRRAFMLLLIALLTVVVERQKRYCIFMKSIHATRHWFAHGRTSC